MKKHSNEKKNKKKAMKCEVPSIHKDFSKYEKGNDCDGRSI